MKKICIFCETWSDGGIESFLGKMLSRMDQTDLQIDLVVARREESVFTPLIEMCGIRIIELSGSKSRWSSNCFRFWGLVKASQYDVVHVNAFQGLQLVYLFIAKRAGVQVRIAHSHGSGLRKSRLRFVKFVLHELGKILFGGSATHCWACAKEAGDFLFRKERRVEIIPNGIDTAQFSFRPDERKRVRKKLGLEGKFVVGYVARMQRDKNQEFLLDALELMLRVRRETLLLLVGEGSERQRLQRRAEELGISDHVLFYGVSAQVEQLFWAMDVFAFPSLSEGLGLVAVEAQATGLPVICSEFIPEEGKITPLFRRMALSEGANMWAKALLEAESWDRQVFADAVRRAGFEIAVVSETVASLYREA